MIGFYLFYATQMAFLTESVNKPGTAFDVIPRFRVHPCRVKFVCWPQIEGFDPGQDVVATQLAPTFQIFITDATVVCVDESKTAMTATAAVEGRVHSFPEHESRMLTSIEPQTCNAKNKAAGSISTLGFTDQRCHSKSLILTAQPDLAILQCALQLHGSRRQVCQLTAVCFRDLYNGQVLKTL